MLSAAEAFSLEFNAIELHWSLGDAIALEFDEIELWNSTSRWAMQSSWSSMRSGDAIALEFNEIELH